MRKPVVMVKVPRERCATCKFSAVMKDDTEYVVSGDRPNRLFCVRYPARLRIDSEYWCGEFVPKQSS